MLEKKEIIGISNDDRVIFYSLGDKFNRNICVVSTDNGDGTISAVAVDVDQDCWFKSKVLEITSNTKNDSHGVRRILNPHIGFRPGEKSVVPQDEILIGDLDRGTTFKSKEAFQTRLDALERAVNAARMGELTTPRINIVNLH